MSILDFKKYIYKIEYNNINLENYLSDVSFNNLKQIYASDVYNFNKQFKIINTIKNIIDNITNLQNNLIIININLLENNINPVNNIIINQESLVREFYPDIIYTNIKEMYDSDKFTEKCHKSFYDFRKTILY
jgi:hypothetical protein